MQQVILKSQLKRTVNQFKFVIQCYHCNEDGRKETVSKHFIIVDPGRDTPDALAEYVAYFDENMIGLSAAPDDLDPVVAHYGAYYEKVPYSNSALLYGVDHTSEIYIVYKQGKLVTILPHASPSKTILDSIRTVMKE